MTLAPNARLKWGLIGASTIADEFMIDAIRQTGSDVAAVFSRSQSRADELAERHDIPAAVSSLGQLLDNSEVQAVYVSSTNDLHAPQVIAAAQAGKHVLCEKPLAADSESARAMVDACTASQVHLATNFMCREQAVIKTMRDLIADGTCGTVRFARVLHAVWLPDTLRTWRIDGSDGGGVTLDLTVHDVDTLRFVLGDEISAVCSIAVAEPGASIETASGTLLQTHGGVVAVLQDGFNIAHPSNVLEVHGTRASLVATGAMGQRAGGKLELRDGAGVQPVSVEAGADPYRGVVDTFTRAVTDGQGQPSSTGIDGLIALEVALAALASAATGGERINLNA